MTFYDGLPGVHKPVPRITQDAGATVLIRIVPDGVFAEQQTLEWAVLDGPNVGAHRIGLVDSTPLIQTMNDAAAEGARYILGIVTYLGAVVPVATPEGVVPEGVATVAGQAISALGWG